MHFIYLYIYYNFKLFITTVNISSSHLWYFFSWIAVIEKYLSIEVSLTFNPCFTTMKLKATFNTIHLPNCSIKLP